jgi:hypothetical protein
MLEHLSEDRIAALWAESQDEDALTREVFKQAAYAVRVKRLAMLPAANLIAA